MHIATGFVNSATKITTRKNKINMKKQNFLLKKYLQILSSAMRITLKVLPNILSVELGKLGYTEIIKRSKDVEFKGKIYQSELIINIRGDYSIERWAAQKKITATDPLNGIRQLKLSNFIMLDIGANVGAISLGALSIGAKEVYAIEPGPLFLRLLNNININNMQKKLKAFKIGLANKSGIMYWAEDANNPGNAHLLSSIDQLDHSKIETNFGNPDNLIEVEVTTLDEFVMREGISNIELIKIDVEGMEWEVLSGGRKVISECRPIVVAETHRVASDMMRYDCLTPMFKMFYDLNYISMSLNSEGELSKFIYPNFGIDTFFIPVEFYKKNNCLFHIDGVNSKL